jgi:hypothetical protein
VINVLELLMVALDCLINRDDQKERGEDYQSQVCENPRQMLLESCNLFGQLTRRFGEDEERMEYVSRLLSSRYEDLLQDSILLKLERRGINHEDLAWFAARHRRNGGKKSSGSREGMSDKTDVVVVSSSSGERKVKTVTENSVYKRMLVPDKIGGERMLETSMAGVHGGCLEMMDRKVSELRDDFVPLMETFFSKLWNSSMGRDGPLSPRSDAASTEEAIRELTLEGDKETGDKMRKSRRDRSVGRSGNRDRSRDRSGDHRRDRSRLSKRQRRHRD